MSSVARFDTWQAADGTNVARFSGGELQVWDGAAWGPAGGLQYASIGTAATGSFTDGGVDYDYWRFTGNGSLVIDAPGLLDVLVVGGGASSRNDPSNPSGGGAGGVRFGTFEVTAGTVTVTVGAGGSGTSGFYSVNGSPSSFGNILKVGGGGRAYSQASTGATGLNGIGGGGSPGGINARTGGVVEGGGAGGLVYGSAERDGITLNFTGSSVEYGIGGNNAAAAPANTGSGGRPSTNADPGSDGVVIVKVRT